MVDCPCQLLVIQGTWPGDLKWDICYARWIINWRYQFIPSVFDVLILLISFGFSKLKLWKYVYETTSCNVFFFHFQICCCCYVVLRKCIFDEYLRNVIYKRWSKEVHPGVGVHFVAWQLEERTPVCHHGLPLLPKATQIMACYNIRYDSHCYSQSKGWIEHVWFPRLISRNNYARILKEKVLCSFELLISIHVKFNGRFCEESSMF